MPKFYTNQRIDINVEEFLDECNFKEIKEVINYLKKDKFVPEIMCDGDKLSISEIEYEEDLNKLHGKWNRLSKEDEAIIKSIANKF